MKKVLLSVSVCCAVALGGCDVNLDLIPGPHGGGTCELPEAAEAAWVEPFDQPALEPASDDVANDVRRWVVHFEEDAASAGDLVQGAAPLRSERRAEERAEARAERRALKVERTGGKVVRRFEHLRAVAAELTPAQAETLKDDPEVRHVEEDPRRYLLSQRLPYGVEQVGSPSAWAAASTAGGVTPGVKTCIIDSGLYAPHEDLPQSGVSGHPAGWNKDSCGHGTHVAGTVAALDNGVGVIGVSPRGSELFVVKVFGDDCGWSYASELADAVQRCAAAGAKVVNMSLGGRTPSEIERDAFEQAWRNGLLLIAAAGNSGTTDLQYPASYPSVLSVGAVDDKGTVAPFSQRNEQVDLVAPGVRIESTVGRVSRHEVTLPSTALTGSPIEHVPATSGASGLLVDGGQCDKRGNWNGRVVACERGNVSFAVKLDNVLRSGGVAAVIYNNEAGPFQGTLGDARVSLPAVAIPGDDKDALLGALGKQVTVVNELPKPGSGYVAYSGTSMASPHVAGAASFIWGQAASKRNSDVRRSLLATAEDLGAAGRDNLHGQGHLRTDLALRHLQDAPATNTAPDPGYFARCSGLECTVYDTSFDADGEVKARTFHFGPDRLDEAPRKMRHTFAGPGPHKVSVDAADAEGAASTYIRELDVLELSAQGSGVTNGGRQVALRWTGAGGAKVHVVRDNKVVGSAKNTGEVVEKFQTAPTSVLRYRVCNTSLESCSNEVAVAPLCGT